MKKRVFIVHGWGGHPDEPWLKWLRLELEKLEIEVIAPAMPNTEEPKIEEWVPHLANLVGKPDEETYFVGHSIGCQAIMRYLEKISPQKFGKVIFVAGWFHLENLEEEGEESEAVARSWIETPIDLEKVKQTFKSLMVFMSDNDPWVPLNDKNIFEEKLGAKVIVKNNAGHFTEEDGALEFQEILEEIKI